MMKTVSKLLWNSVTKTQNTQAILKTLRPVPMRFYATIASTQNSDIQGIKGGEEVLDPIDLEKIEKAVENHYYQNHIQLSHAAIRKWGPPFTDTKPLEEIYPHMHREPKTITDKLGWNLMQFLKKIVHLVFREKYVHHATILETVAAIPGMVGGSLRHFRSLRRMENDEGWIASLIEEAENERMHLICWMQLCNPTIFERLLVLTAQAAFIPFYTTIYLLSPKAAHRFVGYLEEEAVLQYTQFLNAIDEGKIENVPAPKIAIRYYNLPADATLRDVVLCVRADEMMHRDFNHKSADRTKMSDPSPNSEIHSLLNEDSFVQNKN